jgi:tRNA threonylcarbamoyladenosine biosynthesis protein TsaB
MISQGILLGRAKLNIVTLDTSTSASSVAVTVNGQLAAEFFAAPATTHSACLLRYLDLVLDSSGLTLANMDAIGVSLGPGSFTGLRVGIATAKGLSMATGLPLMGFSTLAMLAMNIPHANLTVCPMLDARKNEVYTALYRCRDLPELVGDECVAEPGGFIAAIDEPTLFVGSGALRYRALIEDTLRDLAVFAPSPCHVPRASSGAIIAMNLLSRGKFTPPGDLAPVYIRPSEAELTRMAKETSG